VASGTAAAAHDPPAFVHSNSLVPAAPLQTAAWEQVEVPWEAPGVQVPAVERPSEAVWLEFPAASEHAAAFQPQPRWVQVSSVVTSAQAAAPVPLTAHVAPAMPHVAGVVRVVVSAAVRLHPFPSASVVHVVALGSAAATTVPAAFVYARCEQVAVPPQEPSVHTLVPEASLAASLQSALVVPAATAAAAESLHVPAVHAHPRTDVASQWLWLL